MHLLSIPQGYMHHHSVAAFASPPNELFSCSLSSAQISSPKNAGCWHAELCPFASPIFFVFVPMSKPKVDKMLWLLTLPMLNSLHATRVATSALSREAMQTLGHRLQIIACRDSLAFCVPPLKQRFNSSLPPSLS